MLCIENKLRGMLLYWGDFKVIVGPTPPQTNYFCDLLGTPDAPVSKITSVKYICSVWGNVFIGKKI